MKVSPEANKLLLFDGTSGNPHSRAFVGLRFQKCPWVRSRNGGGGGGAGKGGIAMRCALLEMTATLHVS